MIRTLLTIAAFGVAAVFASEQHGDSTLLRGSANIPDLIGAKQLIDIESHCNGCQPDYCYADKGAVADLYCYKSGFPKCCTAAKGNCPLNVEPGCECQDASGRDIDCRTRGLQTCTYSGVGTGICPTGEYCFIESGMCMNRMATQTGVCKPVTEYCTAEEDPQCGCNGRPYPNPCGAASAGVNIAYAGRCRAPPP